MADQAHYPDSNGDTGVRRDRDYPGMPRWVKVFGVIVIVLIVLVLRIDPPLFDPTGLRFQASLRQRTSSLAGRRSASP